LAFGISFGLGGQSVAGEVIQGWYQSGKDAGAKVATHVDRQRVDRERVEVAGMPANTSTIRPASEPKP
ncbi:MAG: hypothetical protein M3445_02025, partial [Actinomycetota bacterium]|nr:hypothetical protein [Actinomycetota bacterium]